MKRGDELKYHKDCVRRSARLAAKYVKTRDYEQAANHYRSAAYHAKLRDYLQAGGRR